jgi:hypothetical protein
MNAGNIWKMQMEAGENGDIEKSLEYFDENCKWKLMSSNRIYDGKRRWKNL